MSAPPDIFYVTATDACELLQDVQNNRPQVYALLRSELLQKVDKNGDHKAVDEIRKKTAHQRHQKISLDGWRIFFTEHLHVCHGIGSGSHSKSADSGAKKRPRRSLFP